LGVIFKGAGMKPETLKNKGWKIARRRRKRTDVSKQTQETEGEYRGARNDRALGWKLQGQKVGSKGGGKASGAKGERTTAWVDYEDKTKDGAELRGRGRRMNQKIKKAMPQCAGPPTLQKRGVDGGIFRNLGGHERKRKRSGDGGGEIQDQGMSKLKGHIEKDN